jgi:hypothetical protein
MTTRFNLFAGLFATLALLCGSTLGVAQAALLDSATLLQLEQRTDRLHNIETALARESVATQLAAMGVDAAAVVTRLAQLTDEELVLMESRLDKLPAGAGALEVVGIVFVVLLILELVGVIDIFKAI